MEDKLMSQKEDIIEINLEERIQQQKRNKQNVRKGYQEKRQKLQAFLGDRHRNDNHTPGTIVDITNLHYIGLIIWEGEEGLGRMGQNGEISWNKVISSFFMHLMQKRAIESLNNTTIESLPMKAQLRDQTTRRGMFKR
ncbi:unnamed protein product (macronuclear) [Paramecium tetraurelia]|uniref:BZIP domain-containing protein n=1 Tax=Paramecium tetraurelia TaxID=5888 RepID=A0DAN6_PARTE|nr:uncharacterized protein GSPATT00015010001 [Paramecium tetraurelia]CAK80103.1 unnamed protein product [Paramecium tetraurelia]|eukprot:XP_001447500.1 hypothetical protein (macronuclear) [Paramecium tetraurelia strain d4-2]